MKLRKIIRVSAVVLALCIPAARAQESQPPGDERTNNPAAPIAPAVADTNADDSGNNMPATTTRSGSSATGSQRQDSGEIQSDNHALSGAETLGVGFQQASRAVIDPALHLSEAGDMGIVPGKLETVTSFGGSLNYNRSWTRYHLNAFYSGAKTFYRPDSSLNISYHDLSVSQQIRWGRSVLLLRDDLLISPQAAFSGLDTGGLGAAASGGPVNSIQPAFLPSETIQTGIAMRLRNMALGEIDYSISRRTMITLAGSYGLLHFMDPGYIDSRSIDLRAGYDYALSRKDTIAFIAGFDRTDFVSNPSTIDSALAQMAFGRRITGRLAFQATGGILLIRPIHFGPLASQQQLTWAAISGLTYSAGHTVYSILYTRGLNSGSGVYLGAIGYTGTGSVKHSFTRTLSVQVTGGYTINQNLGPNNAVTSHYSMWSGGANLTQQIGNHIVFGLDYGTTEQAGSGTCPVLSCGTAATRKVLAVSIDWHLRTVRIE